MKKILRFIVFTLLVALTVPTAFSAVMPENAPVIGEESKVTDFYSQWQPESFGATRLSDTKVAMALTSGFGQRAGFRTAFDATDFEAEYDMTYIEPGVVAITFFGTPGSYISGN